MKAVKTLIRLGVWALIIFVLGIFCAFFAVSWAQEEDPLDPATTSGRIARSLMYRHIRPVYRWLEYTGVEPISLTQERHYALVIEPEEPGRSPYICVRLRLDYLNDHLREHQWTQDEQWWRAEEEPLDYARRLVTAMQSTLADRLVIAFQQEYDGPMETFTTGVPVFCRMVTETGDPKKICKEDVIYRN